MFGRLHIFTPPDLALCAKGLDPPDLKIIINNNNKFYLCRVFHSPKDALHKQTHGIQYNDIV